MFSKKERTLEELESLVAKGKDKYKTELAICLLQEHGVARDEERAVTYLEHRAYEGDSEAMWVLGLCYEYGMGTRKNRDEASELYERSAKKRNKAGKFLDSLCRGDTSLSLSEDGLFF